ncbi:MAG: PepSY domain-containing protein [Hydrogenophaga sp.]|mgnify:CR=1 FL=1|nr:peptidase M4 [Comamonadaceae bacterium]MBS4037801.1 PepSY domain-containing protein [Hydrogenophaga sp.]
MRPLALLLIALCCASALAGEQDQVRREVEAGRIRPLADILQAVQASHPGKLLDVQLVPGPGGQRWYAVRLLQKDGSRTEVHVDAVTGQEVSVPSRRPVGVLPMAELLRRSDALRAGTVLEMELESSPGLRAVYEVRLLLPSGARQVLRLDAYSGEVLDLPVPDRGTISRLKPMAALLEQLESRYAGRVTELELRRDPAGPLYYDIALQTPQGRRLSLLVDATSGQVIPEADPRR